MGFQIGVFDKNGLGFKTSQNQKSMKTTLFP